jgi:hypothetical protein
MSKQTEKGDYHFAFVEFSLAASAMNAMKELDGNMQYGDAGKPLRYVSFLLLPFNHSFSYATFVLFSIRWASTSSPTAKSGGTGGGGVDTKNKQERSAPSSSSASHHHGTDEDNRTISLFVSFNVLRQDITLTDEILRQVFGRYGPLVDVAIRLSLRDRDTSLQRGYAFICYADNPQGIDAALRASQELANAEFQGIYYKCEPSKRLQERLGPRIPVEERRGPMAAPLPLHRYPQHQHHHHHQQQQQSRSPSNASHSMVPQASMNMNTPPMVPFPNPYYGGHAAMISASPEAYPTNQPPIWQQTTANPVVWAPSPPQSMHFPPGLPHQQQHYPHQPQQPGLPAGQTQYPMAHMMNYNNPTPSAVQPPHPPQHGGGGASYQNDPYYLSPQYRR